MYISNYQAAEGGPEYDGYCGTCDQCEAEDVPLKEHHIDGDCCDDCYLSACEADAQFSDEDRAIRHAENGYGYSGGWTEHEPYSPYEREYDDYGRRW